MDDAAQEWAIKDDRTPGSAQLEQVDVASFTL
jgi:hypothetical protein